MSMHEWNSIMYGIEFEVVRMEGDKALAFVRNHKEELCSINECSEEDLALPQTPDEAVDWVEEYWDRNEHDCGPAALIADLAGDCIYVASDVNGIYYVGLYALTSFPWDAMSEDWQAMSQDRVRNAIRPLYEELYGEGTCPEFENQTIWIVG